MQFWRDAISKTYDGSPPNEPVTTLLAHALKKLEALSGQLNKSWFLRVILAREQYLQNPPYPTLAALESYAESTYSTLLYLTLSALPLHSVTADHLASHIGKACGIVAVLRGLPLISFPGAQRQSSNPTAATSRGVSGAQDGGAYQGAVTLPLDVMADAGLREEDVFRQGSSAAGLPDAVFAVATRANDHLITAREMLKNIRAGEDVGHPYEHLNDDDHRDHSSSPSSSKSTTGSAIHTRNNDETNSPSQEIDRAFGVFMPAVATSLWLDRLQKVDFDIFRPELRQKDWRFPWKAYWAFTRQRF